MYTDRISESSSRLLDNLLRGEPVSTRDEQLGIIPRHGGPTLVLVEQSPLDEQAALAADVLDILDSDTPEGRSLRRRRRRNQRKNRTDLLGQNEAGEPTVNDRTCCYRLAQELNRKLHEINPGDHFKCLGCESVYRLDNLVREERKHGR